jgi:hypothetical protein
VQIEGAKLEFIISFHPEFDFLKISKRRGKKLQKHPALQDNFQAAMIAGMGYGIKTTNWLKIT